VPAPLLATKFYWPPPRPRVVARPHLIARLHASRQGKLTLISAPPGFGKSTLLSHWRAAPTAPPAKFCWLALDKADNDPVRFWTYVVAALRTATPAVGESSLALLQSPQPPAIESILVTLINEIAGLPEQVVLAIDDYHLIETPAIHEALIFLIDHLPETLHLLVASRTDPPWPLAHWRVHQELAELRTADLRFTPAETAAFLNQVMQLRLSAEDVAALEERTEGWIAGLQMAALSLQGREDVRGFIADFTASQRFIFDYLVEEVLQKQPPQTQTFLVKTSVLDRLSAPLCEAVLGEGEAGRPASAALLESLEHANLFIVSLDEERRWYRYHHLFAELLRRRLEQTSPNLAPELHRRASVWYENESLIEEAVAHAFASRDWEHTANVIYRFAHRVHTQTNLATLGGWLAALPEPVMRARPWLCVYQALAWYWTGPRDRIEERLQMAEQALPDQPDAHLAGYIAAIRAHYALVSGNIPRVLAMAQAALQQLPEGDYMRGWTSVALGGAYWGQGNVVAAQLAFQTAKIVALQHNYRFLAVSPACYVGLQLVKQGQLDEAARLYREGLELATVAGGQQLSMAGFPNIRLGDLARERNDLAGADNYLRPGVEQCIQLGHPDILVDAYAALARLQLAQNDWPSAYTTFQKADELAQKSPVDPFVCCWLHECRVRLWLAKGRLEELVRWAEASGLTVDGELSYHYDLHHLNLARVLLARAKRAATPAGAHSCLGQSSALLTRLLTAAEKAGWVHETIKILVLQALVLAELDDKDQALQALRRALTLAEPGGYVRVFVDEGEPLCALLSECLEPLSTDNQRLRPYRETLLAAFPARPEASRPQRLLDPLSEREVEVLRLWALGLTSTEMAAKLFISPTTVRTHIKNIYHKLDATRRIEAIERAKDQGLI
jgi:LuxR family transcriptional regulator, maltose regulon positive regulatory protein